MTSDPHQQREHFGALLLELEHDRGTRDTCRDFLASFGDAMRQTRFRNADDLRRQIQEFYAMFVEVKPRMAMIQNYLDDVLETLLECGATEAEALIDRLEAEVCEAAEDSAERSRRLTKHAMQIIPDGGTVLIHSHSHTVLDTLCAAKRARKSFSVIVAEQEGEHTLDLIHSLKIAGVDFTVVPEYMLSCMEDEISCMIIGAVTLKADFVLAADAGTKAVVSEMNAAKIPVNLLITTNKFSFWKKHSAPQTLRTVKRLQHRRGRFDYDRVKFSHDRLPLDQVDAIVTEDGIHTSAQLKKVFEKLLDEYEEQVKDFTVPLLKRKCPRRRLKGS